jgi:catechol 2,3-dioxygenase-like lactoylglutathione lyase family enzyme
MLHHVSVGVADVTNAARFYDPVLAALGYRRVMEFLPYAIGYGDGAPEFWVQLPHDQQAASAGNGVHVGFAAASQDAVRAFHQAALAAGATDEGAPGPRPEYSPNYYGAFVRDPEGHKLEAVFFAMAATKPAAKAKAKGKSKAKAVQKRKAKKPAPRKSSARRPVRRGTRKR